MSSQSHTGQAALSAGRTKADHNLTLLLVERDAGLRRAMKLSLEGPGLRVVTADDPESARRLIGREDPELLVVELDFPQGKNGELIQAFRRQRTGRPGGGVVVTTLERPGEAWRRRYRPEAVIYKPFDVRDLGRRVQRLMDEIVPAGYPPFNL